MHRWNVCLLLGGFMLTIVSAATAQELRFELAPSAETGLQEGFAAWHAEEAERQKNETGTHGWWPWGLRAFDYDRDGDLDLLASHHGRPHSIILKNHLVESGKLTFTNAIAELGLQPRELPGADDRPWVWDFDGDGWLDIAGLSDESSPNSAWNEQGKKFVVTGKSFFRPLSHPKEVLDLNGDGYLDVDGGSYGQWFYLPEERGFRHEKSPRFATPSDVPAEVLAKVEAYEKTAGRFAHATYLTHEVLGYDTRGYAPWPIDLNGDDRPDLVVQGAGGYGAKYMGIYCLRDEDGALADQSTALGLPVEGAPIFCTDICGDRYAEILICGKEHGGLYLHEGSGRYARRDGPLSDLLTKRDAYLQRAFPADFDNDGDMDLVISQPRLGGETVFENKGDGEFAEVLRIRGWDANPIVIADIDRDGRLDLIVGVRTEDRVGDIAVYLNRSEQTGNFARVHLRGAAPNPYAVGARVEIFPPGGLPSDDARPLFREKAHWDATPVHAGLGSLTEYDVRVTFPDGKMQSHSKQPANKEVLIDAEKSKPEYP